jgi:CreA protein
MKKTTLTALGTSLIFAAVAGSANAEEIGSVDTTFRMMGPNDKIKILAFDDPKIDGVTCYLSKAEKGGASGAFGLAEDPSNASIACRQTGPITIKQTFNDGEEVFSERRSPLFKKLHVTRFWDEKRDMLVYLTHSDKLIDGSPKNSVSAVVPMPWGTKAPDLSKMNGPN